MNQRHARIENSYNRGFLSEARTCGLQGEVPQCPYSILDDPGINGEGAYSLGQGDARAIAKRRGLGTQSMVDHMHAKRTGQMVGSR